VEFKSATRSTNRVTPVIEVKCQLNSSEQSDLDRLHTLDSTLIAAAKKGVKDCLTAERDGSKIVLQLKPRNLDKLTDAQLTALGKAATKKANANVQAFIKDRKTKLGR